ncbi:MAG: hypothetical protein ABJ246_09515 [Paracoccaceae bacterium]
MGKKNSGATHTINLRADKDELIRDLVLGNKSQLEVAAMCGIHSSQVSRFIKKHITEEMRREIQAEARMTRMEKATGVLNDERVDIAKTYDSLARRVERLLTDAEERDEPAFALAAVDGLRKVLRDIAQMQGKLAQELTVNVSLTQAPEWITLRSIIAKVIDEVPAAREPLLRHMRHEALSITKEDQGIGL